METEQPLRLCDVFVSIHDPRQPGKVKHDFVELQVVAVNGVLVGPTPLKRSNCGPTRSWIGSGVIFVCRTAFPRTTPLAGSLA